MVILLLYYFRARNFKQTLMLPTWFVSKFVTIIYKTEAKFKYFTTTTTAILVLPPTSSAWITVKFLQWSFSTQSILGEARVILLKRKFPLFIWPVHFIDSFLLEAPKTLNFCSIYLVVDICYLSKFQLVLFLQVFVYMDHFPK